MPPLPDVPNVYRCDLLQALPGGNTALNRIFLLGTGGAPQIEVLALATHVAAEWHTHIGPFQRTDLTLLQVEATDLTTVNGERAVFVAGTAGSETSAALPDEVALLINFIIARRYKGGKPRLYLAGLGEAALADALHWQASTPGNVSTGWDSFINAVITDTASGVAITSQVAVSYFHGFSNYTGPTGRAKVRSNVRSSPTVDPVVAATVNPSPKAQRRRGLLSH